MSLKAVALLFLLQACSDRNSECVIAQIENDLIRKSDAVLIANEIQPVPNPMEANRLAIDVFLALKDSEKPIHRPLNPQELLKGYREYLAIQKNNDMAEHFLNLRKKHSVKLGRCFSE